MIAQKLRQENNAAVRRNMMMYIVQYWVTFTSHIIPKFHSMLPHFGKIITLFPQSFCQQHRDSLKEILRKLHFRFAHLKIHSKRLKLCTSGLKYIRKPRQNERIVAHSKHSSFLIRNLHFAKKPGFIIFSFNIATRKESRKYESWIEFHERIHFGERKKHPRIMTFNKPPHSVGCRCCHRCRR